MALTPSNNLTDAEKRAKREASEQDALLREVDEAVRQDSFSHFGKRYGIPVGGLLLAGLLAFGGWLWWDARQEAELERVSERLITATDQLDAENFDSADSAFAELEEGSGPGAAAVAKLARAGIAFRQGRADEAAELYAAVAANGDAPGPFRDFATLREVAINYDKMEPEAVVERMKPLARPGAPFFGSAGELLGAAYLDQDKPELAGPLFAEIAKDETVPESLRSRARQLSGLMGIDAIEDVDEALDEMRALEAESASQ